MTPTTTWFETLTSTSLTHAGRAVMRALGDPRNEDPAGGGSGPVLLVGGFAATDPVLAPLARRLNRRGHDVVSVTTGSGVGCAERATRALTERITTLAATSGSPVAVIGHSRGGQFARVAAARAGDDVSALVTLGTPFQLYGLRPGVLAQAALVVAAGTLGVPGLAGLSCVRGACCAEFRRELAEAWTGPVPFTSVFSRSDGAVPWRASLHPGAEHVEVTAGHLGLLTEDAAFAAVLDGLEGDGQERSATRAPGRAPWTSTARLSSRCR